MDRGSERDSGVKKLLPQSELNDIGANGQVENGLNGFNAATGS